MKQLPPDDYSSELARLYEDQQQQMKRYLAEQSYDKEGIDDYYQDIFLKILENSARNGTTLPQDDDYCRNWLKRIAHNRTVDANRRTNKIGFIYLPEVEEYTQLPELTVEGDEGRICDRDRLQAVLAQMPLRNQQCVLLLEQGYKQKKIAEILRISESRVSEILRDVENQLQQKIFQVPDLQRAEAMHAEQVLVDILQGVKGVIEHEKIAEYAVKALDWHDRQDMKKHISELRSGLLVTDLWLQSVFAAETEEGWLSVRDKNSPFDGGVGTIRGPINDYVNYVICQAQQGSE